MNDKSCALFRAANLRIMDYPFDAALHSALSICDRAVIVVSDSVDDTDMMLRWHAMDYGHRITVVHDTFTYDLGWQERWWNTAVSHTDAEWLMFADADEVIDPCHADTLRGLMDDPEVKLIRFPFIHLYATCNYRYDFNLTHNTRLGRRSAGYRMVNQRSAENPHGAACAMIFDEAGHNAHLPDWNGLVTVDFPILHYGWCRDAQALALSQAKHHAWYANGGGLEDGRLPEVEPHNFNLAQKLTEGKAHLYEGDHPDIIYPWLNKHAEAWVKIEREVCKHENKTYDNKQLLASKPPKVQWTCANCGITGTQLAAEVQPNVIPF